MFILDKQTLKGKKLLLIPSFKFLNLYFSFFVAFVSIFVFIETIMIVRAEDSATNLEEGENASESDPEEDNSQNNIAIEVQNFSDLFRSQSQSSFKGVVLGNVLAVTEDYLYVKPIERELGRMYIYMDDKTMFSKMANGKRQRGKKDALVEGTRVAARVLMKEGIILADEFFLVEGEFESRSRYRKLSYTKKKSGDEAEKPKSGGHH